jgi:hypothetical protein
MALNRSGVEAELAKRRAPAGLTKADANTAMRAALLSLGIYPADWTVSDFDLENVERDDEARFLDAAERRLPGGSIEKG